jgi:hypothetical protein
MTQQIQKPKINTKNDIVGILKNFAPDSWKKNPESVVKAVLGDAPLSVGTESKTQRQIILEGMEHIKALVNSEHVVPEPTRINGKTVSPVRIAGLENLRYAIDDDIENALGATRVGLDIVWNLPSGRYVYNIFEHQLKREDNA